MILKIRGPGHRRATGKEKYEIHNACCKTEMLKQQLATQAELGTAMQSILAHGARSPTPSSTNPIGTRRLGMPNYFTSDAGAAQNESVTALGVAVLAGAGLASRGKVEFLIYSNAAPTVSTPHQLRAHVPPSRGPTVTCAQCADNARQGHYLGMSSWRYAALDVARHLARSTVNRVMQGNERSRHQ